jgi:hypothetical protein
MAAMAVSPAICLGLAVAIGAQQLEVLEAIVQPIAIYVVELHVQGPPLPHRDPAPLTALLFESLIQKALLEVTSVGVRSVRDE